MQKWIILIIVFIIVIITGIIVFNIDVETEYVPETEIEDAELRKTLVTLYFNERETGEIVGETRLIDSKSLLKNPYEEIICMLINGPENEKLEPLFSEKVKIESVKFEAGIVYINFAEESKKEIVTERLQNTIEVLGKTLKELNEVNEIKILIGGVETNLEELEIMA